MASNDGIRTFKTPTGEVKYDSDMPMGVLKALMKAGTTGDLGGMQESLTELVTEWCYDGDPTEVEAWDNLRRTQFQALTEAMMEDLASLGGN